MSKKCPKNYNHNILLCFKNKKRKEDIKKKINILLSKKNMKHRKNNTVKKYIKKNIKHRNLLKKNMKHRNVVKKKDTTIERYFKKMFIANCNRSKRKQCERKRKICNMKTNRCIKPPKKTRKRICNTKKQLYCRSINKVCNVKTNRCRNRIVFKKRKTLKINKINKEKNNKINKEKIKKIKLSKSVPFSYSPSVNKKLLSQRSISPIGIDLKKCDKFSIYDKKSSRCVKWDSKEAKRIQLRNLQSKKKISCRNIIAPKQFSSNCWFNSLLMTFFVSDLGRKYNKWLRECMVTYKTVNGTKINDILKKPFFLFNNYIETILRSEYDSSNFSKTLNTNEIIKVIYSALNKYVNKNKNNKLIEKVGVASNPLYFYEGLYNYLGENVIPYINIYYYDNDVSKKYINDRIINYKKENNKMPKVIFLEIKDELSSKVKKYKTITVDNNTYTLDSVVLRDTEKNHFTSYITCNQNQYAFDGLNKEKRLRLFNWKDKLNKNVSWRTSSVSDDLLFNFNKGYSILIYYMTKKNNTNKNTIAERVKTRRRKSERQNYNPDSISSEVLRDIKKNLFPTPQDNQQDSLKEEKADSSLKMTPNSEIFDSPVTEKKEPDSPVTEKKEPDSETKQSTSDKITLFIRFSMGNDKYKKKFMLLPTTKMGKVFEIFKNSLNLESSNLEFDCKTKDNIDISDTPNSLNLKDNDVITAKIV